ncbi:MAG: hypothetical protein V4754_08080 [Pseudomonadota bacterium]
MTQYTLTICYDQTAGTPATPIFSPSFNDPTVEQFKIGDVLTIGYSGPGTVLVSALLAGPKKAATDNALDVDQTKNIRTPFNGGQVNPINLMEHPVLTITGPVGLWGFTVAFAVQYQGNTAFHYLPDPELHVGSTPH